MFLSNEDINDPDLPEYWDELDEMENPEKKMRKLKGSMTQMLKKNLNFI